MAINTYATLKTAVSDHMHRADLSSVVGDFVTIAEGRIADDVRMQEMEASTTGALSAVSLALPTGFLEAISVKVGDFVLDYVLPAQFDLGPANTQRYQYTISGTNFVFQAASGTYQIRYYKRFTAFSANSDTNALLTDYPQVYLYAALAAATDYTLGDSGRWHTLYKQAIGQLRAREQRRRYPVNVAVRTDAWVV